MTINPSPLKIAGRITRFKDRWLSLFGQCWVTDIVQKGYFPEWSETPPLAIHPISGRSYNQELDPETSCFVSELFLVPKKGGKL